MPQRKPQPASPPGSPLLGPEVTYLLELLIGGTGVPQEAIRVEDAACIVLEAPQVVAGCKVLSSWESKGHRSENLPVKHLSEQGADSMLQASDQGTAGV